MFPEAARCLGFTESPPHAPVGEDLGPGFKALGKFGVQKIHIITCGAMVRAAAGRHPGTPSCHRKANGIGMLPNAICPSARSSRIGLRRGMAGLLLDCGVSADLHASAPEALPRRVRPRWPARLSGGSGHPPAPGQGRAKTFLLLTRARLWRQVQAGSEHRLCPCSLRGLYFPAECHKLRACNSPHGSSSPPVPAELPPWSQRLRGKPFGR